MMIYAAIKANSAQQQASEGEVEETQQPSGTEPAQHRWCKIFYEPENASAQNYYFMHFDTRESVNEEPAEPYWIWDALTNNVHGSGLQNPTSTAPVTSASGTSPKAAASEPETEYKGYNPKIHGSYDPNADYAQYHNDKLTEEKAIQEHGSVAAAQQAADYAAIGTFNRFSGGFQSADKSTERHNDFNKSGRQMNAFFDVDAAANVHDGKSLKEERRNQKLSKKEIQEMSKKRRDRKEKKRLDFYKS
ncbi:hypothetical protein LTR02_007714 [Friedmanniomyces endolithicus]|nr:hypothetical protein LTR75_000218 [Friedmanniomyces endolithicus]KAK0858284.1 hypothetical protein LTR03_000293 [Friedmanniomyces endolithicus]KAK0903160.1 hypothetical protein LTR02_007714 [Friedmanniomyces endolithicus]KAK0928476.1 hypothetical protein LTR57_002671 [Friedmanniomyces endolithicus]KAK1051217.1 hypothetical protein LTS16_002682 [Friedmanniomyces endolithicus]